MKILHLFDFFSIPHGGGSVDSLYRLSQAQALRGHEISIYTSDFKLDQEYIDSLQGVKVYPFHSWLNILRMPIAPGLVTKVKKTLREFDIIHLHQYRSFQNIVIHRYATKYNIPYVLQAHGSLTTFFQKGWLKRTFDVIWGYRILNDASKLIAVTEVEAEQYKSMGVSKDKIEIIPHGISLTDFENLPSRGTFREKYGFNDSEQIILYLGRINEIKGINILIQAFAGLSTDERKIKLVIIGPDEGFLSSLKNLITDLDIEDKVVFTGPLYGQEKFSAYIDADVYVLPSVYEIFGITVLEACACGTPVVVTDRCGIANILDGEAGLVTPYDPEQLRHRISTLLDNEQLRLQLGEKGRLLVREKLNWETIVDNVEGVYQSILTHG